MQGSTGGGRSRGATAMACPHHRPRRTWGWQAQIGLSRIWGHPTWFRTVLRRHLGLSSANQRHPTPTHCPWGWCGYRHSAQTQTGTLPRIVASWATTSRSVGMWGWRALGGRMRDLLRVRAPRAPPALRHASRAGWERRWWGMLSCAQQTAVASTLLGNAWRSPAQPFGDEGPQLSAVLQLADSEEPSRLPLRS